MSSGRDFSFVTRYVTVEDFVNGFKAACGDRSLFLGVIDSHRVHERCEFRIQLADRTPVLHGTCVVLDVFTDANNAFGRPGTRIGIEHLAPACEAVFAAVLATRADRKTARMPAVMRTPALMALRPATTKPRPSKTVYIPAIGAPPPAPRATPPSGWPQATPPFASRVHVSHDAATAQRTPGSPLVLPANPLIGVPAASLEGLVECRIYEDSVPPTAVIPRATPRRRFAIAAIAGAIAVTVVTIAIVGVSDATTTAGAAAIVATEPVEAPAPRAPTATASELARVTAPPPAREAPPPDVMVLVQSTPSSARVTSDGRFVGFTPTWVHVPEAARLEIAIERAGWKPVTRVLANARAGERLTVRLEPAVQRVRRVAPAPTPAVLDRPDI